MSTMRAVASLASVARCAWAPSALASRRCVAAVSGVRMPWAQSVRPMSTAEEEAKADTFSETAPEGAIDGSLPQVVEGKKVVSEKIQRLADEICALNLLETADLCEAMKDKLGVADADLFMPMGFGGGGGGGGGEAAAAAEEAAPVAEKTHFDVKLKAFDAKAKIKIIKEVRAVTGLGLKEAKELVESAPAVVMKDMKKEDAEALVATLADLGGELELE